LPGHGSKFTTLGEGAFVGLPEALAAALGGADETAVLDADDPLEGLRDGTLRVRTVSPQPEASTASVRNRETARMFTAYLWSTKNRCPRFVAQAA
jgi:hypothetical protein